MDKRKIILACVTLILLSLHFKAQDFKTSFLNAQKAKDTVAQGKVLREWEKSDPKSAELFVSWFNYYALMSMKAVLSLEKNARGKESLELKDSSGKNAGYINNGIEYNLDILDKGYENIEKGITLFPNRLDMRFGKVYMYGKTGDYQKFTDEIIRTVEYSGKIKNAWLWRDGKDLDDPKKFMLDAIQDYVLQLYDTNDDSLLKNMRHISETVLKHYPDHVESLSNISITYMIEKNHDKALTYLLKAEKLAPEDFVVLGNIAYCYNGKGDKTNTLKYYKLVAKHGDEEARTMADQKIKELEK
jgi:tetratricopeptide (TPR) repeat protein